MLSCVGRLYAILSCSYIRSSEFEQCSICASGMRFRIVHSFPVRMSPVDLSVDPSGDFFHPVLKLPIRSPKLSMSYKNLTSKPVLRTVRHAGVRSMNVAAISFPSSKPPFRRVIEDET